MIPKAISFWIWLSWRGTSCAPSWGKRYSETGAPKCKCSKQWQDKGGWRVQKIKHTQLRCQGREKGPGVASWKTLAVCCHSYIVSFGFNFIGGQGKWTRGVRIERSRADYLSNSKSEFHQLPVVRVFPTRGIILQKNWDRNFVPTWHMQHQVNQDFKLKNVFHAFLHKLPVGYGVWWGVSVATQSISRG